MDKVRVCIVLFVIFIMFYSCKSKELYLGTWNIKRFGLDKIIYDRPNEYLITTVLIINKKKSYFPSLYKDMDNSIEGFNEGSFHLIGDKIYFDTPNELWRDTFEIIQKNELSLYLKNDNKIFELYKIRNYL